MDAQQIRDHRRLINRRFDEKARLRREALKRLSEERRDAIAVLEQHEEQGRIDNAGYATISGAIMDVFERDTAIILEQYKLQ